MWQTLSDRGIDFLLGQLSLICAAPGIGKSAFALALALESGAPTLYFSADSDAVTQGARAISTLTGIPMDQAKEQAKHSYGDQLGNLAVRFVFDPAPTLDLIKTQLKAFEEQYGVPPDLVVVDNITNVITGFEGNAEDPFGGLESLMDWLHQLARDTGAHVCGLHHVTGEYNNGNTPIPLRGIKGQIGRVPEMVLTLHRVTNDYGPDELNVSPVKNRANEGNPSGYGFISLQFTGETMQITDRKET